MKEGGKYKVVKVAAELVLLTQEHSNVAVSFHISNLCSRGFKRPLGQNDRRTTD